MHPRFVINNDSQSVHPSFPNTDREGEIRYRDGILQTSL